MPIIPSVFQPIKSRDVQQRPFKAYKRYRITDTGDAFITASGHIHMQGIHRRSTPHVGDQTYNYPVNTYNNTNQHVVWNSIDHRYYRYPYDPGNTHELYDKQYVDKYLGETASILSIPYFDVGEKIKPGSFNLTSSVGTDLTFNLSDDGYGNLRDPLIDSGSMPTASRNFFYLSLNEEFNQLEQGNLKEVTYYLKGQKKKASVSGSVQLIPGIQLTRGHHTGCDTFVDGVQSSEPSASGWAAKFTGQTGSYIRIPHDDAFNILSRKNDWTISYWCKPDHGIGTADGTLSTQISKVYCRKEEYFDKVHQVRKMRDVHLKKSNLTTNASGNAVDGLTQIGTIQSLKGFELGFGVRPTSGLYMIPLNNWSDGRDKSGNASGNILASTAALSGSNNPRWYHILYQNSGSLMQLFVDGVNMVSQDLPGMDTTNKADLMIGCTSKENCDMGNQSLAEIRMYDYALNTGEIQSLSNRHARSGSLYQTNTAGNIFYKNGHAVVSSPMLKYHSGSAPFHTNHASAANTYEVEYRSTHTIYENEVFIRVPKDICNVSTNPSATFNNITLNAGTSHYHDHQDSSLDLAVQSNLLPGEHIKHMFQSGTALPYITTLGLYNDRAQLIAIAKLAQPIQKRDDIDMNFVVRWDY